MMRAVTLGPPPARALRDLLAPAVLRIGPVRDAIAGSFSGVTLRYPRTRDQHRLAGTRATEVPLAEGHLTDIQREHPEFVLVREHHTPVFAPRSYRSAASTTAPHSSSAPTATSPGRARAPAPPDRAAGRPPGRPGPQTRPRRGAAPRPCRSDRPGVASAERRRTSQPACPLAAGQRVREGQIAGVGAARARPAQQQVGLAREGGGRE